MKYEELLKRGREKLPESVLKMERFKIPKVKGHIQGNKTVVSNFGKIAALLRRDPEHLLKFILKEIAAPGEIKKSALIIGSKISASKINQKIIDYADAYVICKECNRPDTKLMKEKRLTLMKCAACGARYPVD